MIVLIIIRRIAMITTTTTTTTIIIIIIIIKIIPVVLRPLLRPHTDTRITPQGIRTTASLSHLASGHVDSDVISGGATSQNKLKHNTLFLIYRQGINNPCVNVIFIYVCVNIMFDFLLVFGCVCWCKYWKCGRGDVWDSNSGDEEEEENRNTKVHKGWLNNSIYRLTFMRLFALNYSIR